MKSVCGSLAIPVLLSILFLVAIGSPTNGDSQKVGTRPARSGQDGTAQDASPPATSLEVQAKFDHERNTKDAARLAELAADVKQTLERSGEFTTSLNTLKELDEIEKLSKKLRTRLRANAATPTTKPAIDVETPVSRPKR